MIRCHELCTCYCEWRKQTLTCVEVCAHSPQGLNNAIHGATPYRCIAIEHPATTVLSAKPTRQKPEKRAGVCDIYLCFAVCVCEVKPHSADYNRISISADARAQGLDCGQRRVRISRIQEIKDRNIRSAHGAEQGCSMGDRLVRRGA
jgi:hypothetical protein